MLNLKLKFMKLKFLTFSNHAYQTQNNYLTKYLKQTRLLSSCVQYSKIKFKKTKSTFKKCHKAKR